MKGYEVLPGIPEERERLEALKQLPALERQLEKIITKLLTDKRNPGLDREAEKMGISEHQSHAAVDNSAVMEYCSRLIRGIDCRLGITGVPPAPASQPQGQSSCRAARVREAFQGIV